MPSNFLNAADGGVGGDGGNGGPGADVTIRDAAINDEVIDNDNTLTGGAGGAGGDGGDGGDVDLS